ncbi:MAG TPA: hypothetical protein VHL98_14625 [Microvirga sp.]|jgi:hypothetical protein|nr:hypothetical protein [Microvirga sp.]
MRRILTVSAGILAAGLFLMPDDAAAQRGGRGGGGGISGGGRGSFGGGGAGRGGWGDGGALRQPVIRGGLDQGTNRGWAGRAGADGPALAGRADDRRWRRHVRYRYYGPWYGGWPAWGIGAGFVGAAAYPYYGYGYGPGYVEPEVECVVVRRKVKVGKAWRVRLVKECA